MEDSPSLKLPSSISSSAPVPSLCGAGDSANDNNSGRKSYFSQDSKLVSKMEYGPASADTVHSGNRMNSKAKAQCVTKATVAGGDYPHGNPNIPHPPPPPLPPPPALKPLELGGQNLPSEVKVEREKMEKGEKLMDNKTAPPSLLPQTSPLPPSQPPPHPHHYSPTGWQGGTATGCQGSWGYTRYSGNHHAHQPQHQPPVQQQQLPSVYNPPSSRHSSSSHPPYLPHPHKEYLPRYASGGGERERGAAGERERGGVRVEYGGREIGRDFSASSGGNSSTSGGMGGPNGVQGREFGGQNREYQGLGPQSSGRDPPMGPGGREFGPGGFRERERDREREREGERDVGGREFPLQNRNENQNREFGPTGAGGGRGHPRDKEGGRWGEFGGQMREAGGNVNPNNNPLPLGNPPSSTSGLPAAPMLNRDPPSSPQNNPSHPTLPPHPHPQSASKRDYPPSMDQGQTRHSPPSGPEHFHREYPPGAKDYPPGGPPSTGPVREYPSPPGMTPNLGRDYPGGPQIPHLPHPHFPAQQPRDRDRERDTNQRESSLYQNRGGPPQPPSLSPSSSSSTPHGHPPNAPYPPPPPPPPLPTPQSSLAQPQPPSGLGPNHVRPANYSSSNQTPATPLSPLLNPSTNQMGGFPSYPPGSSSGANMSLPGSGVSPGCRPSPFHSTLNSHAPFSGPYHPNGNSGNNLVPTNSNSNSSSGSSHTNSLSQSLSPQNASKGPPPLSNPGNNNGTSAPGCSSSLPRDGHSDSSTGPPPPPVIKEEPIEEREESESPPPVLRSPSPEPKPVDIPIHASQSAR